VVSQIATVDKSRLLEKIGTLSKEKLAQVIDGSRQVISQKVFYKAKLSPFKKKTRLSSSVTRIRRCATIDDLRYRHGADE
jgi:hypothetical protein